VRQALSEDLVVRLSRCIEDSRDEKGLGAFGKSMVASYDKLLPSRDAVSTSFFEAMSRHT
jgi:hypothetical protein